MIKMVWDFLKTTEGASLITALSSVVLTVTTVVYAWLTAILAKENRLLRKAGTEPQIVAYLSIHPQISGPLNFTLANVGQGPAFDVLFRVVSGGDEEFRKRQIRLAQLSVPLTVIPQGERYQTLFGLGWDLLAPPRLPPFVVEVTYRDLKKRGHSERYTIDVAQFEGLTRVNNDTERDVLNEIKTIAGEVRKWTTSGLPVETHTREEQRQEEKAWRAERDQNLE
jgi:hypothetical protein